MLWGKAHYLHWISKWLQHTWNWMGRWSRICKCVFSPFIHKRELNFEKHIIITVIMRMVTTWSGPVLDYLSISNLMNGRCYPALTAQTCQVSGLKGTQAEGQAGVPEPMFLSIESSKIKCTVIYYLFFFFFAITQTLVFQSRFEFSLEKDGKRT